MNDVGLPKAGSQILKGIDQISIYIDTINPPSEKQIRQWIKQGMPARLIGRTWYSHKQHVDQFFLKLTFSDNRQTPDDILKSGE